MKSSYIIGNLQIGGLSIPQISSKLNSSDFLGAIMVRWGINRDNYRVEPGLYAIGNPGPDSDVFVTANYKLTFDNLRKNLSGINGWILVLNTRGVNVWCAAGKGTFSPKEIINRLKIVSLDKIVSHRRLILPQLGATGVSAHKVREQSGFNVMYGPVLASDIKRFINSGYRSDREMRKVTFNFTDRIKLIPNDFVYGKYYLLGALIIVYLMSGLRNSGISFRDFSGTGGPAMLKVFLAYFAGIVITPMFLPYIPGRHFSLKGFISGTIVFLIFFFLEPTGINHLESFSWLFIMGAISSFTAMNFTGSSTFTSLSGVKKEMKIFVPLQVGFAATGIILQVVGKLI
jgi:hypothetical protein